MQILLVDYKKNLLPNKRRKLEINNVNTVVRSTAAFNMQYCNIEIAQRAQYCIIYSNVNLPTIIRSLDHY